jgi:hypothetical protein
VSATGNWTIEDLKAIEAAIAKGVEKVKYVDKEVTYRSLSEMKEIRDMIAAQVCPAKNSRQGRTVAATNKGLC